jgi:hypothetical protein
MIQKVLTCSVSVEKKREERFKHWRYLANSKHVSDEEVSSKECEETTLL